MIKAGRLSEMLCNMLTTINIMSTKCAIERNYAKSK